MGNPGPDGERTHQESPSEPGDSGVPLLSAQGITKRFQNGGVGIDILTGVDLTLKRAETLAVVGASGIGKSTLLHILGTLDRPDSGRLMCAQEDVLTYDHAELARFRNETIGFVFQFHYLLAEFSALENTMMPAMIKGIPRGTALESAEEILVRVGLGERLHHRVAKLSGGEQQRVALARALVLKPALLLADEPTGNLDKGNSEQIHALLRELNREYAMTMIVVTHNMELASFMARQVTIVDGKLEETR